MPCITFITKNITWNLSGWRNESSHHKQMLWGKPTLEQDIDNILSRSDTDFYNNWGLTNSYPHFFLGLLWNLECVNSLSNSLSSSRKQYQELSTLTYLTGNLRLAEIRCSNTLSYHKDRCSCRQDITGPPFGPTGVKRELQSRHQSESQSSQWKSLQVSGKMSRLSMWEDLS